MATVYLETTIISYLAAKPSRDVVTAGHQQTTHDRWDKHRPTYNCVISDFVFQEISAGNPQQANRRLNYVADTPVLIADPKIDELANQYVRLLQLPLKSKADASHLAAAVYYQIDYLLTWNMKHLCSTRVRKLVEEYNRKHDLFEPMICTPEELRW